MHWRSGRPWPVAETIEKIMSIRLDEFEAGLLRLARSYPIERIDGACRFRLGDRGSAVIAIATLPDAVLGGLMRLPRAQVSIRFDGRIQLPFLIPRIQSNHGPVMRTA